MQSITAGLHPPPSKITMLPIIDLDLSNYSCIYSVLLHIIEQSKILNVVTPCVTFDQPLWFKSMETVKSESLPIVCRLGRFHTSMSFLGSIGKLMDGSGWKMVLETIYGENIVEHITTGKAISREIRGHFIVDAALHTALIAQVFPGCALDNENNSEDPNNTNILFKELSQIYDNLISGESSWHEVSRRKALIEFSEVVESHKMYLQHSYRTEILWN